MSGVENLPGLQREVDLALEHAAAQRELQRELSRLYMRTWMQWPVITRPALYYMVSIV